MFGFASVSLTTSMQFLPPPPYDGNCNKIGTKHVTVWAHLMTQGIQHTPFDFRSVRG